ncbi:MAG TPA: hypothetical protein VK796_09475, partial [Cytophaga sp.]|nr:hypothetical protein [Cytophaga sp.]
TSNILLNIPGHSIAEIIHAHVIDGTLVSYEDDSIKRPMTPEKFKSNATQYLDVPAMDYGSIYEKGDTIQIYISNDDYWYGETRYFIVQKQFDGADYFIAAEQLNGPDFLNDSNLISKLKRYYPPLIPIEELNVVDFRHRLSFDQNGNNKKYKLEDVVLYVSADAKSNVKGIQYPLCYVHWQDLRSVLLNDPRASFIYKGQQVRLIDVIEKRAYLSAFLKTGYIEIGE